MRMMKLKWWLALFAVVAIVGARAVNDPGRLQAQTATSGAISSGELTGSTATMGAPVRSTAMQLDAPPQLTAAQLAQAEAAVRSSNLSPGRGAQGQAPSAAAPPNSETSPGPIGTLSAGPAQAGVSPQAPGDLTIFYNSFLAPTTGKSTINEPSTANMGGYVFYTGNWYAARSTVGGQGFGAFPNWTYINPYADMSDFCCDQDVVADRGRQFFMWYRQGVRNNEIGRASCRERVSYSV